MNTTIYYDWNPDSMLEVSLQTPDAFLKIKETLTRIGIASKKDNTLYQSCHILHKRGRYYIVSFLELFALDGKDSTITQNDVDRRNQIAILLEQWGLLKIVGKRPEMSKSVLSTVKIITHKEKSSYNLVPKYSLGKKSHPNEHFNV